MIIAQHKVEKYPSPATYTDTHNGPPVRLSALGSAGGFQVNRYRKVESAEDVLHSRL